MHCNHLSDSKEGKVTKYKCQSCGCEYNVCGDAICSCGGDLAPMEMPRVEIPLAYPTLFTQPKITHDEWCDRKREDTCESGDCIMCKKAFDAGSIIGKVPDKQE